MTKEQNQNDDSPPVCQEESSLCCFPRYSASPIYQSFYHPLNEKNDVIAGYAGTFILFI